MWLVVLILYGNSKCFKDNGPFIYTFNFQNNFKGSRDMKIIIHIIHTYSAIGKEHIHMLKAK